MCDQTRLALVVYGWLNVAQTITAGGGGGLILRRSTVVERDYIPGERRTSAKVAFAKSAASRCEVGNGHHCTAVRAYIRHKTPRFLFASSTQRSLRVGIAVKAAAHAQQHLRCACEHDFRFSTYLRPWNAALQPVCEFEFCIGSCRKRLQQPIYSLATSVDASRPRSQQPWRWED